MEASALLVSLFFNLLNKENMLKKVLTAIAIVYIVYFLLKVFVTGVSWTELNLFGVAGLYLALYYINNIKIKSNEHIS